MVSAVAASHAAESIGLHRAHVEPDATSAARSADTPPPPSAADAPEKSDGVGSDAFVDRGTAEQHLTRDERQIVAELRARDREVRAHEHAHKAAGGQYAGGVSLEFTAGPDGRRYAVGGEVPIDASPVPGDPEATIRKMAVVVGAALAPSSPSAQDRAVAAQAAQAAQAARAEVLAEKSREKEPAPNPAPERDPTAPVVGGMIDIMA